MPCMRQEDLLGLSGVEYLSYKLDGYIAANNTCMASMTDFCSAKSINSMRRFKEACFHVAWLSIERNIPFNKSLMASNVSLAGIWGVDADEIGDEMDVRLWAFGDEANAPKTRGNSSELADRCGFSKSAIAVWNNSN